jgi:hypothetical protein
MAISFQAALLNGGPVSLSYGVILASLGVYAICLSLGEMASMYVYRAFHRHCNIIELSDPILVIQPLEPSIAGQLDTARPG